MSSTTPPLNFDRARFAGDPPASERCAFCGRGVPAEYFRVGPRIACPVCAENARNLIPSDTQRSYTRALLFGAVAAVVACTIFSIVQMYFMIGYVALGVGWLIGKAMKAGSRGRGGRRYQVTAAILTYVAISLSFIPLLYKASTQYRTTHSVSSSAPSAGNTSSNSAAHPAKKSPAPIALGVLLLVGLGLISPVIKFFLSIPLGLFGLLWLFLGIQAAWRTTVGTIIPLEGPFRSEAPAEPPQLA